MASTTQRFSLLLVLSACGAPQNDAEALPRAFAGFDRTVGVSTQVTLDGSGSKDPTDQTLAFSWRFVAVPEGSSAVLAGASSSTPMFTADVEGLYAAELVVSRGDAASAPDLVVVSAQNQAPIAVARCGGTNVCTAVHGRVALLDARQSYDPDTDDVLSFAWIQLTSDCTAECGGLPACAEPSSTAVTLSTPNADVASFGAPAELDLPVVFQLEVSDGVYASTACLAYTVTNTPPIAVLAPSSGSTNPAQVNENGVFTLSGSGSGDSDGDSITYAWEQVGGTPLASITSPSGIATQVTAPTIASPMGSPAFVDLTFRLTVSDGLAEGSIDLVVRVNNNT